MYLIDQCGWMCCTEANEYESRRFYLMYTIYLFKNFSAEHCAIACRLPCWLVSADCCADMYLVFETSYDACVYLIEILYKSSADDLCCSSCWVYFLPHLLGPLHRVVQRLTLPSLHLLLQHLLFRICFTSLTLLCRLDQAGHTRPK